MAPIAVDTPKLGLARPLKPESSRNKPVMYRTVDPSPVAVKTENIYVTFEDGSVVIDAMGGAAVSILGFGNQTVIQAVKDEMDRCGYIYAGLYSNSASEKLASFLIDHSQGDFAGVNFVGGGSECIESCLKLAKQYWWEKGNTTKRRFIGRKMSYHGNTIAALSVGWHPIKRLPFASLVNEDMFSWVSAAHYVHGGRPGESEEDYATRLADELDAEIRRLAAETVAAFVLEPMVATSIGAALPPKTYFTKIKAVCDKHDVLLVFDEIMCGMWRTGRMFTYWRIGEGVKPDIVATAKALGGGYVPIAAVFASPKIMDAIHSGSGIWNNGFTYTSFGVSSAGALAVQKILVEGNYTEKIYALEKQIGATLRRELAGLDDFVADVRGLGLMWAVEVKAPGQKELKPRLSARIQQRALELGITVLGMAGVREDGDGDIAMICPPAVCTEEQMDTICTILAQSVKDVRAEVIAA